MGFLGELVAALDDAVLVDADDVEPYRHDRTTWVTPGAPRAVVRPTTTLQVAEAVRIAARHDVPVLPRGAGSSLAGGASAIDGCLVVSLERMDRIVEVQPDDQLVVVEAGVLNTAVSTAVADHDLFYPPDPASRDYSTIGGNIATNAGGLCCVKYGVTRDHVLGLEVVLADGSVVRTGRRTVKSVAGLDVTSLLVGSEGTLGIVTGATLRLRPRPDGATTAVARFRRLTDAGAAIAAIARAGVDLSLMEIMDRTALEVVAGDAGAHLGEDVAAVLLLQSDAPAPGRDAAITQAAELCAAADAIDTTVASDPSRADALLAARRMVGSALDAHPHLVIHEDVAVPRSRMPEMIGRVLDIAEHHRVRTVVFGHAGDGNLHPALLASTDEPDEHARLFRAFEDVLDTALALDGTITGEHGLGAIKGHLLGREVGEDGLRLQETIRGALDPDGRWCRRPVG